jgi:hypothetical protein
MDIQKLKNEVAKFFRNNKDENWDENWADELDMYLENKGYEVAHILDGLDPVDIVAVRDDIIYVVYLSRPDLPADDPESYGFYQI